MVDRVLWEGQSKSLGSAATGGKVVSARYRITDQMIFIDTGVVSSSSEQIPMWAVRDVDVRQSVTQKARKLGDVVIRCQHNEYTGKPQITLASVENPNAVRGLLNEWSSWARSEHLKQHSTVHYSSAPPPGMLPPPPPAAAPAPVAPPPPPPPSSAEPQPVASSGDDMMAKLSELSEFHSSGVLTDEEFTAAKAKLLA